MRIYPYLRFAAPAIFTATAELTALSATGTIRRSIPEYEPVSTVVLSEDFLNSGYPSSELLQAITDAKAEILVLTNAPKPPNYLPKLLTKSGLRSTTIRMTSLAVVPHSQIWLRDYGPFPIMIKDMDLGRKQSGQQKWRREFIDFKYGGASQDEVVPRILGGLFKTAVTEVPVVIDGGNLLSAGDVCLTSSSEPAPSSFGTTAALTQGPYLLEKKFGPIIGCDQVIVLRDPPHEHVDMWLKVVGPNTLLVNELSAPALAAYQKTYGAVPQDWIDLRDRLDRQAAALAQYFVVKRIPMPLPYRGVFRTYANSILVNGTAIVPRYQRFGWDYDEYPDANLAPIYETKVAAIYKDLGYHVRFVNADGLIFNGGAFHCIALQIPRM